MNHHDEGGRIAPAQSKVARAMRGPVHINVTYTKGPFGKQERKQVSHVVHGERHSSRGYPEPARVGHLLRKHPRHRQEIKSGWRAESVEGRYGSLSDRKRKRLQVIVRGRKASRNED